MATDMYSRLEGDEQPPAGLSALCYVIFLGTLEWGMVIPTLWPLLQRMGAPETYFGLVIGTFSLTRVICQPLIGAMGDRFPLKVLLCCCLLTSALGGVLYALAPVPWMLLASRIVCGLGASCTPLLFAWSARAMPSAQKVASAQVRLNTMRALGTFIGPFSSVVLRVLPEEGIANELNSAGWIIAVVNVLGVVFVWFGLTDLPVPTREEARTDLEADREEASVWSLPVVWICLLFQVVTAFLLAVLEVVPPLVITDEFHMPPTVTSVLFGVASLLVIGLFGAVEALSRTLSSWAFMCAGVTSIVIGLAVTELCWMPGGTFYGFVLPWLVLTVPPAPLIRTPARTLYTSSLPGHVQGVMQGISEAAFSFANFLGPIVGSKIAASGGVDGLRLLLLAIVSTEVLLLLLACSCLAPAAECQEHGK